jgi:hypothetical protein
MLVEMLEERGFSAKEPLISESPPVTEPSGDTTADVDDMLQNLDIFFK